jgi:hypothetical protein
MKNNKILLFALCGLSYISTSFGMDTQSADTITVSPQRYDHLSEHVPYTISRTLNINSGIKKAICRTPMIEGECFSTPEFSAYINEKHKTALIHILNRIIVERITLKEEDLLTILPSRTNLISRDNPLFFHVEKDGTTVAYKVTTARKVEPRSDMDRATKIKKIVMNQSLFSKTDSTTKLEKPQTSHWPTTFAGFLGGSMFAAAFIIIYTNLYNK